MKRRRPQKSSCVRLEFAKGYIRKWKREWVEIAVAALEAHGGKAEPTAPTFKKWKKKRKES